VVTETVLQFTGLSKTFGATRALIDVDFDVRAGEVHGLVGRNGSGKSTLIKVLSGYHVPDPGSRLVLDDQEINLPISGREAADHGLVFVHQDLGLVPAYSVLENIRLNSWQASGFQRIHWKSERTAVEGELERFGLEVDPNAPVITLSQVDRAIVAIVRAMHHLGNDGSGKVLVLDEPTAYLPTDSVERLFEAVRTVAATGAGVVFVSHRTDEVLDITDRITVLRDGQLIDTVVTEATDEHALVSLILGRTLESFYPDPVEAEPGERVLTVTGLNGTLIRNFDLNVDRGEIVGITGLMGAGHDEVPYYIFGARDAASGHVVVNDQELKTSKATPTEAIAAGVALLPADRLYLSGTSEATVEDNVALPVLKKYFSRGRLQLAAVRERVGGLLTTFDVRPAMPNLEFSALSGGNQQKALLAKWLQMEPSLLLLHEPTQGVDVGSKADIFSRITEAAEAGTAVVIASAEHEDLANLCTRVVVFDSGRVVGELSGADLTEERILDLCYRGARGRGAHGMVFQWRPYRVGFVPEGPEPELVAPSAPAPRTRRVFRWSPHRVGYVDMVIPPAPEPNPATPSARKFRWSPHRVGYVD
jgi:ribose transport system ATP-binding protein